jgi:hypothetical protein
MAPLEDTERKGGGGECFLLEAECATEVGRIQSSVSSNGYASGRGIFCAKPDSDRKDSPIYEVEANS